MEDRRTEDSKQRITLASRFDSGSSVLHVILPFSDSFLVIF